MARGKKKVRVNAIDKYLKQIKYRESCRRAEEPRICQPKVVIQRIRSKRLQELIDFSKVEKNQNKVLNIKVPIVKLKPTPQPTSDTFARRSVKEPPIAVQTKRTTKKISSLTIRSFKYKSKVKTSPLQNNISSINQKKNVNSKLIRKVKAKLAETNEKNVKKNNVDRTTEPRKLFSLEKESLREKPQLSSSLGNTSEGTLPKSGQESNLCAKNTRASDVEKKSILISARKPSRKRHISFIGLENSDVVRASEALANFKKQEIVAVPEAPLECEELEQSNSSPSESCLCEPLNFDTEDFRGLNAARESLIPAKYRPCVEELESLTPEMIDKFIKDNQQYYIDSRRTESERKVTTSGRRKGPHEFKDAFKCNPFSSTQQVAMYLALREIFSIPSGSFLECRHFFTTLMPEVCCQLFAKIFRVKDSSAPRLMKKLYPQPVCLV